MERRRGRNLGVRALSGHGRLHLHVAALRGAEGQGQPGQVFDGGVRILAVQRAAAHGRRILQLFVVIFSEAGAVAVAPIDAKSS